MRTKPAALLLVLAALVLGLCAPCEAARKPKDALNDKVDFIFDDIPLKDAAGYLESGHDVKIELANGVKADTNITSSEKDITLKEALDKMLDPHDLTHEVEGDAIRIIKKKKDK